MEGYKLNIRLAIMIVMVLALTVTMTGRLVGLQIISGEELLTQSERTISRTTAIPAARGGIYDRNGRALVTNRLVYSVTIDRSRLFQDGKQSSHVLGLIRAAQNCGIAYKDEFPVSAPPFNYTEMTAEQERRLKHYILKKGLPEDISAADLADFMMKSYGIIFELDGKQVMLAGVSMYDARLILGVLYEIDVRYEAAYNEPYTHIPPYTFASDITMELVSVISEQQFAGVDVICENVRQYETNYAAHILGRTGSIQPDVYDKFMELGYSPEDIIGIDGVEEAFESWLRGVPGRRTDIVNKQGKIQDVQALSEPSAGNNVYLTLDIRLQEACEQILAAGVKNLQRTAEQFKGQEAQAAAAVILDVKTSEILAIVNYPTFSLETFSEDYASLLEDPLKPMLNRAIAGLYPPGSTFKMVTAAAALESGMFSTNYKITDRGRYTYFSTYQPTCSGNHGAVNVCSALGVSCNYYFYEVGRLTGITKLVEWAKKFGFGNATGIEIRGEKSGFVAGPESAQILGTTWYPGNILSSSIGQSDHQMTPIQLANYAACIANGGNLNGTHLLKEVKSYDNNLTYHLAGVEEVGKLDMKPENLSALQEGMHNVTHSGTAYRIFAGYEYDVAAKTGSAQQANKPTNGVFVAYAPYNDPQVAIALVVENGGGGAIVSPIARDMLTAYFKLQEEMSSAPKENSLQR